MRQAGWILSIVLLASTVYAGTYGGGNGTADNFYILSLPEHLTELSQTPADWVGRYYRLEADIDMSAAAFTPLGSGGGTPFQSILDGNEFAIHNLSCNFITNAEVAQIRNLTLVNATFQYGGSLVWSCRNSTIENCRVLVDVTCSNPDLGGMIGTAYNCTIRNCQSAGTIAGGQTTQRIGGLIGTMELGTLTGCSSSAVVTGGNTSENVGGLIGMVTSSATVTDCGAAAIVSAPKSVGGLIGYAYCNYPHVLNITNCLSASTVTALAGQYGSGNAGGLIGSAQGNSVMVSGCGSTGPVSTNAAGSSIGGLIGILTFGHVAECFSHSSVTGALNSNNVGGLIGWMAAAMADRCYSTGAVSGGSNSWYVGGLIGMHLEGSRTLDCYSTSSVSGYTRVGGLIGYAGNDSSGQVSRCFAAGAVTGTDTVGGLIGANWVTVSSCFYDNQTTGQTTSAAGKGKSTADMQNALTFTSAGWDLTGETANGTNDYWHMNGYPMLAWQPRIAAGPSIAIELPRGRQQRVTFTISSVTGETLNWILEGAEDYPWIVQAAPAAGTVSASNTNIVTLTVDTAMLVPGDYAGCVTVTADNGNTADVIIKISVYDPIGLSTLATLSRYWLEAPCDWGQPCKAADWFIDGSIDSADLLLLADAWLGKSIDKTGPVIFDGFETGDFTVMNWQQTGALPWVTASGAYEGTLCAKSGTIGNSESSELTLTYDLTGYDVDTISFAHKVSSESGYDYLTFYIDGVPSGQWSGVQGWQIKTAAITPGLHTFRWTYSKDSGESANEDTAWIDNVRLYKM